MLFACGGTVGLFSRRREEMLAGLLATRRLFTFLLLKEFIKPICSNTISSPSLNS